MSEVFEHFVEDEYVFIYEHLCKNFAGTKPNQKQVHMCLSGTGDERLLEFYKDAYMQE